MASFDRLMRNGVVSIPAKISYMWARKLFVGEFSDCPCLVMFQDEKTANRTGGIKGDLRQIKTGKKSKARIPACFSEFSNFTGEITFIGAGNRLEIWYREEWKKWNDMHGKEYENTIIKILSLKNRNA